MTAQQLRNSILQQAIQGRLVPQDPSEGSADVLLSAIRQKKELLYKSKKISKRDFEVSEIQEDEIPFDIPESWAWIRIGEIFKHSTGKSLNEANRKGNPHEYITTSNVFWNRFELKKLRQMYYTDEELDKCQAEPGDLLVLEGGDVGRAAVWNKDYKICLQNHIHKLHPYEPLDVYFYYYCFFLYHDMGLIGGKGIGIQGLSSGALHNIVFPLPPLAEQRRIVAKIEELMPLVEKYGKAQTELDTLNQDLPRRLRQSVLQQAIQGKLVEQDEKDEWSNIFVSKLPKKKYKTNAEWPCEEPFDLPNGWNWCHIGDVCEILNGYAFKSGNYVDSGIRIMRISNVQAGVIVDKDPKFYPLSSEADIKDYVLKEGDMLMSLTGNVGRVGILKADMLPAALNQRVACLRLHNEEIKPFFYHYLQSEIFRMRCESSGHGMAQLNISTEWLKQELIPLPPLAEQRRIVAKIEELFAEIDKLK